MEGGGDEAGSSRLNLWLSALPGNGVDRFNRGGKERRQSPVGVY